MATAAVLFALLVESGNVQVWHAYAYVLYIGVPLSITQPVRQALIANTVPREAFGNAYAANNIHHRRDAHDRADLWGSGYRRFGAHLELLRNYLKT